MRVLVMTEYWSGALACIQSFGRRGHHVSVLYSGKPSPHAYSRFVKGRIAFDGHSGERGERAGKLLELLREGAFDLVVPVSDEDAHLLAECKVREPALRGLFCPALEVVETVRDRARSEDFCRRHGIRIPQSMTAASAAELHKAAAAIGFPLVIKESYTVASQGVRIVNNSQELAAAGDFFAGGQAFQVQEFIRGDFIGVTGFGWRGRLLDSFTFRTDYQYSHAGTPPYSHTDPDEAPRAMLEQITALLDWTGGIDLDLLRNASGELYLMEINPRLSGTAIFPLKLGIDLPRYYEAALDGSIDSLPRAPAPTEPVLFVSFPEEVLHISRNPMENLRNAMGLRKNSRFVESLFPDDAGLTRWQMDQFLVMAWFESHKLRAESAPGLPMSSPPM